MQFPSIKYKQYTQQHMPNIGVLLPYMNDHSVAARFLEAVQVNPSHAWAFVSKVCAHSLDLEALHEILGTNISYRPVQMATYFNDTKNCMTRSLYIEDPNRNIRRLLHLRMIKEPDKYGIWKIYGVEQEECARIY